MSQHSTPEVDRPGPDRRWGQSLTDLAVQLLAGLATDDEQTAAANLLDDLAVILAEADTVDEAVARHVRAAEHIAALKVDAARERARARNAKAAGADDVSNTSDTPGITDD